MQLGGVLDVGKTKPRLFSRRCLAQNLRCVASPLRRLPRLLRESRDLQSVRRCEGGGLRRLNERLDRSDCRIHHRVFYGRW